MSRPSRIAIVKELGSRTPRCLAAHAVRGDEAELVIVERYPAALGADVLAVIEEDAKALVTLEHPNLATLISTAKLKGDVAILSEWVDGESLAVVLGSTEGGTRAPVDVVLRAFVDTLEALSALHGSAASPAGQRVCGPFTPEDVFVGVDGVTRLTRFSLGRVAPGSLGSRRAKYAAPEFTTTEPSIRRDIFTAGLILWECLMGEPLAREEGVPKDVAARVRAHDPTVASLGAVVEKALGTDPNSRYATAAEMLTAVTNAGPKAAQRAAVSQHVARVFGERIAARLVKLEPKAGGMPLSISAPSTTEPPPPIVVKPQPPAPAIDLAPSAIAKPADKPSDPKLVKPETAPSAIAKPADKPSDPKLVDAPAVAGKTLDSTPRLQAASAIRKPTVVGAASLARKAVPLPKRPTDSAPNLAVSKADTESATRKTDTTTTPKSPQTSTSKVNGNSTVRHPEATPATKAAAPTPVTTKAVVEAAAEGGTSRARSDAPVDVDIDIPIGVDGSADESAPPPSAREDIDVDVDLVSVRPPPAPKRKKSLPPAAVEKARPTANAAAADEETPAPPPSRRGVLFVGVAIILFGAGFLVGRATAPEALAAVTSDPQPTAVATTSVASTAAASVSVQAPQKPTATNVTSASAQPPEKPSSTASAIPVEPVFRAPPQPTAAAKLDASSSHYDPGGI